MFAARIGIPDRDASALVDFASCLIIRRCRRLDLRIMVGVPRSKGCQVCVRRHVKVCLFLSSSAMYLLVMTCRGGLPPLTAPSLGKARAQWSQKMSPDSHQNPSDKPFTDLYHLF